MERKLLFFVILFISLSEIVSGQKKEDLQSSLKKTVNTAISAKSYAISSVYYINFFISSIDSRHYFPSSKAKNENYSAILEIDEALKYAADAKKKRKS